MVMPDREVPGIQRHRLPEPHDDGMAQRPVGGRARRRAGAVGPVEDEPEDQGRPADDRGRTHRVVEPGQRQDEPGQHHRHRRHPEAKREVGVLAHQPAAAELQSAAPQHGDVAAEVEHHRAERADVDGDVDRLALIVEARDRRQQDQMPRRRDRQELGDPLHDGDEEEVQERHGGLARRSRAPYADGRRGPGPAHDARSPCRGAAPRPTRRDEALGPARSSGSRLPRGRGGANRPLGPVRTYSEGLLPRLPQCAARKPHWGGGS